MFYKHTTIKHRRGQANPYVHLCRRNDMSYVVCRACDLHFPLLHDFLIRLDLIADLEIRPGFEAHAALSALAHFGDVLLDVFEGGEGACQ